MRTLRASGAQLTRATSASRSGGLAGRGVAGSQLLYDLFPGCEGGGASSDIVFYFEGKLGQNTLWRFDRPCAYRRAQENSTPDPTKRISIVRDPSAPPHALGGRGGFVRVVEGRQWESGTLLRARRTHASASSHLCTLQPLTLLACCALCVSAGMSEEVQPGGERVPSPAAECLCTLLRRTCRARPVRLPPSPSPRQSVCQS